MRPIVIKLGGSALTDKEVGKRLGQEIIALRGMGIPLVIVHGGGPAINQELQLKNISWEFYQGQRITTPEMMEVIEMVLTGKVNRQLVRTLNQLGNPSGLSAQGLAGTDNRLLLCSLAAPILQRVGMVEKVNTLPLELILEHSPFTIPVLAPIGVDVEGGPLNVNADWAASKVAQALQVSELMYVTDQEGVLDSSGQCLPHLTLEELHTLCATQTVKGGMLVKAQSIASALDTIPKVSIVNGKKPGCLLQPQGTLITKK